MRKTKGLNRLKIDNGIFLDETRLVGIREYSVTHSEKGDLATLTIKMDVTTLEGLYQEQSMGQCNKYNQQYIEFREVVQVQKIKIVSMVRIHGELIPQENITSEQFKKILEEKIDGAMRDLCFERIKTA